MKDSIEWIIFVAYAAETWGEFDALEKHRILYDSFCNSL